MLENPTRRLAVAAISHVGMVRSHQEDAFAVFPMDGAAAITTTTASALEFQLPNLLVVADGMGGMEAGEVASNMVISALKDWIQFNKGIATLSGENISLLLRQVLAEIHDQIAEFSVENEIGNMGTTVVLALLSGSRAHFAWVGDSRCYLFRQQVGTIQQISKDHSLVQGMVDAGEITPDQAFMHPKKNVITQCLGIPGRMPIPDTTIIELVEKDLILLCSDGLNTMLNDEEIASLTKVGGNLQVCANELVEHANKAGGHDNITVVLAQILGSSDNPISLGLSQAGTLPNPFSVELNEPVDQAKIQPSQKSFAENRLGPHKPSMKLMLLMVALVSVLVLLTVWFATKKDTGTEGVETSALDSTAQQAALPRFEDDSSKAAKKEFVDIDSSGIQQPISINKLIDSTALPTNPILDSTLLHGAYVLRVGVFSDERNAKKVVSVLKKEHPGYHIEKTGPKQGPWEVYIKGFGSRAVAEQFNRNESVGGIVILDNKNE